MKKINMSHTEITRNLLKTNRGAGGAQGIAITVLEARPVKRIFQESAEVEQSTFPQLVTIPLKVLKATGT